MYKIPMNDPFEADVFASMLETENIPFTIVDHSSLVFDGLFQMTMGWGHVEVPDEYKQSADALHQTFVDTINQQNK